MACSSHSCVPHKDVSIQEELIHHIPYAITSLALGLIVLSFFDGNFFPTADMKAEKAHLLFHTFHFLHIIFALTGSLVMFARFSKKRCFGMVISLISALVFCTLSDVVLPYVAGTLLGVHMHFHICFIEEYHNIIPFLLIGLLNGWVLSQHGVDAQRWYSVGSHFGHILISSLASLFYLVSEGFYTWYPQMGLLFIFLIIAVVIPCTLADVIVPMKFAKLHREL